MTNIDPDFWHSDEFAQWVEDLDRMTEDIWRRVLAKATERFHAAFDRDPQTVTVEYLKSHIPRFSEN